MLKSKALALMLFATAGAVAVDGIEIPQASAFPAKPIAPLTLTTDQNNGIELIATKKEKRQARKRWLYNRSKHGPRYRNKTTVYKYYYGGYYYSRPWWTIGPGLTIVIK